ncbi:hypothetical protein BKA62DRAFT_723502 [Auriculariales sp. MPI-PUGE-AT-0066]|nr:hypothetical protein BKA62DRAFT_723502 [Auriculariales sp. MPI-PUGE-AT-0066]
MPAYLDAVGGGPSLGSRGQKQGLDANIQWTDPRALSAAGLTYLAVRQVFTRGWCREAATFLRLSAGVIEGLPAMSIVRMWFGRVILLWDLGLGLAASPYGPLRLQRAATSTLITSVVQVHQHLRNDAWNASRADMQAKSQPTSNDGSPHSDPPVQEPQAPTNPFAPRNDGLLASRIPSLDGDARVFDSLVSLCLDLCFPPPAGKQNVFTGEAGVFAQYEPLRIQRWLESLPTALSSGTLQMVTVPEGWVRPAQISYTPPYVSSAAGDTHAFVRPPVAGDAHPMERVDRQALARVVQLVYYILCTRYYKPIMDYAGALPSPTVPSGTTPGSAERLTLLHVPAVRMATIRAAMANIVDTADWFIHTRHYWLWAFAEQGLVFAQNSALGRITNPNDASSSGPGGAYGSAVEGPNGGVLPSLAASSPATSAPGSTPGNQNCMGATTPMGSESSTPAPGKRSREEAMSPSANSDDPNSEENLRDVLAAGAQIPPDAPRRGLLLMIQDVLSAALDAFTVAPYLGAGHLASTRVLLTVAAAALSGANNSTARPILFIQRRVAGGLKARRAGEGQAQGKQDTDEERPAVRMRTENGAVATRTGSGENGNGMDMMLDLFQPSVSGIGR